MGVVHSVGITLVTGRGGALGDLVVDTVVHGIVVGVVHNVGIALVTGRVHGIVNAIGDLLVNGTGSESGSTVVKSECCVPASRSKNVTVQIVLC